MRSNDVLAAEWVRDFEQSEDCAALSPSARSALRGSVQLLARYFTRRWDRGVETSHGLDVMTAEDVRDLLTRQFPHAVSTPDPEDVVDGVAEFLIWAARRSRVRERKVEYACRGIRAEAIAAMQDERTWSASKGLVMAAIRGGVDTSDVEAVRAHALGRGLDAEFVDELLPPGPTWVRDKGWGWLPQPIANAR